MKLATGPDDPVYMFDDFVVDPVVARIYHDGREIPVTPKALKVLLILLESPDQVVRKDTLFQQAWPETFVEDNTLVRTVSMLRKSLHDSLPDREYIATVPGRGYRWTGPVRRVARSEFANGHHPDAAQPPDGGRPDELPPPLELTPSGPEPTSIAANAPAGHTRGRRLGAAFVAVAAVVLASGLGWFLFFADSGAVSASPHRRLWRLTSTGRLDSSPAWSPDGRLLAYSSDRGANFDIWVQPVGEGSPIQITADAASDTQPTWSPDSRSLAFRSQRLGGGLFVVSASGGAVRRLTSFGDRPQWSPDGSRILFYSRRGAEAGLYTVDATAAATPTLILEFEPGLLMETATWHPDGRRVSFLRAAANRIVFTTVSLDGGSIESRIAEAVLARVKETGVRLGAFTWAKSGDALYFEGQSDAARNLWKVQVDPRTLEWLDGPERLSTGAGVESELALSPDGNRLAFGSRTSQTMAWSFPFDSVAARITGPGTAISPEGTNAEVLDVSPDGTKLAYRLTRRNQDELWIRSLTRSEETLHAVEPAAAIMQPRWSSDGTQLAYFRRPTVRGQAPAVLLLNPSGGDRRELPGLRSTDMVYDWSRDGQSLLMRCAPEDAARSTASAICLLPLQAAAAVQPKMKVLAKDATRNLYAARYSPDGRWISFVATTHAFSSTVYVMSADGGAWIAMSDGQAYAGKPRWAPDGRTVYFLSERDGFLNVWGQAFNVSKGAPAGAPYQVSYFESSTQMIQRERDLQIVVARDRLVVPITQTAGAIWVLDDVAR